MKSFRHLLGLVAVLLTLTSHAAPTLTPGQKLSEAQLAQLGTLPVYDVGGIQIRVIPSPQSDKQNTLLVTAQGVVGSSRNEVTISEAPAQRVQALLQQTLPQPLSVQHYEPTGIIVLRYADFEQAVKGQRALKAALPDAKVRLPVQFGRQIPH